jgi:hypothetical protein
VCSNRPADANQLALIHRKVTELELEPTAAAAALRLALGAAVVVDGGGIRVPLERAAAEHYARLLVLRRGQLAGLGQVQEALDALDGDHRLRYRFHRCVIATPMRNDAVRFGFIVLSFHIQFQ